MSDRTQILRLDGLDYDLSRLSADGKTLVARLTQLERLVQEKTNLLAVLTKAKNAYISDLKSEIIKKRTGVDLSALFEGE